MRFPFTLTIAVIAAVSNAQSALSVDEAINLARANRASVRAATLRVEQARLTRRSLSAPGATRLFLGYSSDLAVGGSDDDAVIAHPLDFFGRSRAGFALGDAQVAQAEASLRQTLAEIQGDVVTLYSETVAAREQARIASESLLISERLHEAIKNLVTEGRVPGIQSTRVSIEVERARLTAKQRDAEFRSNLHRLAAAVGTTDEAAAPGDFPVLRIPEFTTQTLQSSRFDLLLLSAEVRVAEAEAGVARASARPELEIQARKSAWQDQDQRFGARIQLSFPLFDGGRVRAEVGAASKRAEAAKRALEDATKNAVAEIEAAKIEIDAINEQVLGYASMARTARDLVEKSQLGLREGANTLVDVLDALRAFREVEQALVEARLRLLVASARYLRASGQTLGGGR